MVLGTVQVPAQGCRNAISRAEGGGTGLGHAASRLCVGPCMGRYWQPVPHVSMNPLLVSISRAQPHALPLRKL